MPVDAPDASPSLSRVYDREYARAIMREAASRMAERAEALGGDARRRVELLRLRFEDGLHVRDIARQWQVEARFLHQESAKAGREFKAVLRQVVGLTERCAPDHLDRECDRLLQLLR
jgi:RNA polymerase sigma-70 factor (ECF subfamily)